jgi:hypothetical protein
MRFSRNSLQRATLLAFIFSLYAAPAQAYIDPGTGSAIFYVVTGLVISLYFVIRGFYYRIVEFLFRFRFKSQKSKLAIHSEHPRYEITFLPVIRALADRNIELTYFTMYERGDSFEPLAPQVTHQSIPPGLVGYSYLNHLETKMLVTTTPQLDVMTFRRSRKVKHYCHIPHALGESRFVRPYAYDFFDSVFCCGPILKQNIRKIESIRKLPAKDLFDTGIPHWDELLKQTSDTKIAHAPKTVLIAPSWGAQSLFQVFGTGFVHTIAKRYNVIVRPHPQMKLSQHELYEEILSIEDAVIDMNPTPIDSMTRADILVSDISGIVDEFVFIHEKPAIVVAHDVGLGGFEGHLLGDTVSLRERRSEFVVVVPPSDMDQLCDKIETVLLQSLPDRITQARDELVYNFGKAGAVAAAQIEEILSCL